MCLRRRQSLYARSILADYEKLTGKPFYCGDNTQADVQKYLQRIDGVYSCHPMLARGRLWFLNYSVAEEIKALAPPQRANAVRLVDSDVANKPGNRRLFLDEANTRKRTVDGHDCNNNGGTVDAMATQLPKRQKTSVNVNDIPLKNIFAHFKANRVGPTVAAHQPSAPAGDTARETQATVPRQNVHANGPRNGPVRIEKEPRRPPAMNGKRNIHSAQYR